MRHVTTLLVLGLLLVVPGCEDESATVDEDKGPAEFRGEVRSRIGAFEARIARLRKRAADAAPAVKDTVRKKTGEAEEILQALEAGAVEEFRFTRGEEMESLKEHINDRLTTAKDLLDEADDAVEPTGTVREQFARRMEQSIERLRGEFNKLQERSDTLEGDAADRFAEARDELGNALDKARDLLVRFRESRGEDAAVMRQKLTELMTRIRTVLGKARQAVERDTATQPDAP